MKGYMGRMWICTQRTVICMHAHALSLSLTHLFTHTYYYLLEICRDRSKYVVKNTSLKRPPTTMHRFLVLILSLLLQFFYFISVMNLLRKYRSCHIKYVRYNLKILHSCHTCSCWLTNNISYIMCEHVHDLSKFHMLSSSSSLVTVIKPKAKKNFPMAAILLFYIIHNVL
jgi:hypothetical protein